MSKDENNDTKKIIEETAESFKIGGHRVKTSPDPQVFIKAVRENKLNMLPTSYLNKDFLNSKFPNGLSPIEAVISANNPEMFELILSKGADINAKLSQGNSPLLYALSKERLHPQISLKLIESGADIFAKSNDNVSVQELIIKSKNEELLSAYTNASYEGEPPKRSLEQIAFMKAVKENNLEEVERFINNESFRNSKFPYERSLLSEVMYANNPEALNMVLSKEIDVNEKSNGYTPLVNALRHGLDPEVIKTLFKHGADIQAETPNSESIEQLVNKLGNKELTNAYSKAFNDHNNQFEQTIQSADVSKTISFIEKGSDINKIIHGFKTPLSNAIEYGNIDDVKKLIEKGADVNVKFIITNDTPLIRAVQRNDVSLVETLIQNKADVNATLQKGSNALNTAINQGNNQMVNLLIEKGALIESNITERKSPLILAVEKGNIEIIKTLIDKGADINAKFLKGKSALSIAIENGNKEVLKVLVEKGGKVNSKDKKGKIELNQSLQKLKKDLKSNTHSEILGNDLNESKNNTKLNKFEKVKALITGKDIKLDKAINSVIKDLKESVISVENSKKLVIPPILKGKKKSLENGK